MKVVIPVAGLGSRMLPSTKAIPKEMLPIIDKPIIQYIVEEVISAGLSEIVFITHASKNSIENHFDKSFELEAVLENRLKRSSLKEIKNIANLKINISSVRQSEAKGLGHAILQSREVVGNNPFVVVLPDRVMNQNSSDLKSQNLSQMMSIFNKEKKSIILLEKVARKDVSKYGIVRLVRYKKDKNLKLIEDIIEKPLQKKAPSNFAAVGRYIFTPEIFDYIGHDNKTSKEIELSDAIKNYIKSGNGVLASFLNGECFDCGTKEGYLEAIFKTAIHHKDLGKYSRKIIKNL
mgnify:FL=1